MRSPSFFTKIFSTFSNLYYKIFVLHNAWKYWSIILLCETHFCKCSYFWLHKNIKKKLCFCVFRGYKIETLSKTVFSAWPDMVLDQIISISNLVLVTFIWLPMKALYWAYFLPGPWPFAWISYHNETMLWQ